VAKKLGADAFRVEPNVCCGSEADVVVAHIDVRFTP
jgi:hypothetical protein